MEIWPLNHTALSTFFLVLIRVSTILFMFPFFNARIIPTLLKGGLALLITIILFPVVHIGMVEFPHSSGGMVYLIISELIIGMLLGLSVQLFFEGIKIMGQLVGFQTGFAITNILDPQNSVQISILSNLAYLLAMTLFLVMNGHLLLLESLRESFEIIKIGSLNLNREILKTLMDTAGDMFVIGIKIGAPAIAALLFAQVAFGLMNKFIPQMNIMIVAFPVQIVIGLLFFGMSLSLLLGFMEHYINGLGPFLKHTMSLLSI